MGAEAKVIAVHLKLNFTYIHTYILSIFSTNDWE